MKFYAGIGSRETPGHIIVQMVHIARELKKRGFTLRSGGAPGADTAFACGAGEGKRLYLPWHQFNGQPGIVCGTVPSLRAVAKKYHPAWSRLKPAGQMLMTRNTAQVLGYHPEAEHSKFVVCWTPDGKVTGGTGQALRIAEAYNIPIYNLADEADYWDLEYQHMGGDAWPEG